MPITRSGKSSSFYPPRVIFPPDKVKSEGSGTVASVVDFSSFAFKGSVGESDVPDNVPSSGSSRKVDELGVAKRTRRSTRLADTSTKGTTPKSTSPDKQKKEATKRKTIVKKETKANDTINSIDSTSDTSTSGIKASPSSPAPVTPEVVSSPVKPRSKARKRSPSKDKKSPKSPKSPRRKKVKIEAGSLEPPADWESLYELVEELREDKTAPVDTDGGEALPQRERGEVVYRYQVLVALMLSSQTKDAVVGETMRALQKAGLDVDNINAMSNETLNGLIGKVGFHNNKTKYLKQAAKMIIETYNGDIPPTAEEMMKLPGVGPKMAYIIESIAFGVTNGIGVDTHMHRMFNDIGWVKSKTPEQTREQLEGWLPREKWREVNVLWVGFGQESQQQKEKMLKKALACSKPHEALDLLKKVGMKVTKEAKRFGLEKEVENILG